MKQTAYFRVASLFPAVALPWLYAVLQPMSPQSPFNRGSGIFLHGTSCLALTLLSSLLAVLPYLAIILLATRGDADCPSRRCLVVFLVSPLIFWLLSMIALGVTLFLGLGDFHYANHPYASFKVAATIAMCVPLVLGYHLLYAAVVWAARAPVRRKGCIDAR